VLILATIFVLFMILATIFVLFMILATIFVNLAIIAPLLSLFKEFRQYFIKGRSPIGIFSSSDKDDTVPITSTETFQFFYKAPFFVKFT